MSHKQSKELSVNYVILDGYIKRSHNVSQTKAQLKSHYYWLFNKNLINIIDGWLLYKI